MFFTRLLSRSFTRQPRRRGLIALTVALSTAISVAMLGVVLDVGDKLNAELTTYGSNIVVQPKADAVVSNLYETDRDAAPTDGSVPQARPKAPAKQLATTVILSLLIAAFTVGAIATTSLFLSANKEYKQAEQTLNQANEDLQTVQGESK